MYIFNTGEIYVPSENLEKTIELINQSAFGQEIKKVAKEDFYEIGVCNTNLALPIEFEDAQGGIECILNDLVTTLQKNNIDVDIDIKYDGDFEGGYLIKNGKVENCSIEDLVINDSTTKVLKEELKSRKEEGFYVDTPVGRIYVSVSTDPEHQGVCIDFQRKGSFYTEDVAFIGYDSENEQFKSKLVSEVYQQNGSKFSIAYNNCDEELGLEA